MCFLYANNTINEGAKNIASTEAPTPPLNLYLIPSPICINGVCVAKEEIDRPNTVRLTNEV